MNRCLGRSAWHPTRGPALSKRLSEFRERRRTDRDLGATMRFHFAEIFISRPEAAFFRSRVMHR